MKEETKKLLVEIKNLLNIISVKGDDVLFLAEVQVRLNKLLQEGDNGGQVDK